MNESKRTGKHRTIKPDEAEGGPARGAHCDDVDPVLRQLRQRMLRAARSKSPLSRAWSLLLEVMFSQQPKVVKLATDVGLTLVQVRVLTWLSETPLPMGVLAERMQCDASNVTGLIDRLETRELVERRPSEGDRRVKQLVLTKAGAKLRERMLERMLEPPEMLGVLTAKELETLCGLLEKLSAAAEAGETQAG
jgi:MarR family transcriptional regulator, organic hydroperoxide resistance regulator